MHKQTAQPGMQSISIRRNASAASVIRALTALIVATIGATFSAAHAAGPSNNDDANAHPSYPTKDTEMIVAGQIAGVSELHWLDGNHIAFPGYEIQNHPDQDGHDQKSLGPLGVYILNTTDYSYKRYSDLKPELSWFFCFNRGFIAYSIDGGLRGDSQMVIRAGPLGHDVLLPQNIYWSKNPEMRQCHGWPKDDRQYDTHIRRYALAPEDGYIVVGEGDQNDNLMEAAPKHLKDPVQLVRPGKAEPIKLPITAYEMGWNCKLTYSDYAHKYLLAPHRDPVGWPPIEPKPIYAISPNGKVDTYMIPHGWELGTSAAFLTRRGLFWATNATQQAQSKTAGGWLTKDGQSVKLFDQLTVAAGVSPDGCKLAYQVHSYDRSVLDVLKVMDLCQNPKEA